MRKILFILLYVVPFFSNAQVEFKPSVRVGLNVSKLEGIDIPSKNDIYFGISGGIKLSKTYTLQPELSISKQGAKGYYAYNNNGYFVSGNTDISLQYLSFSINNKFQLFKNFNLLLGEFNDIVIGDKIIQENSRSISKGQDIDYGIFGGIGYEFPKGIGFEVRVKKGFGDALDDYTGYKSQITNLVFQFGATYTIKFNKKK
ncbi:outer membrane beta-barrel protein [Flavobacterium aciduliphilum]|uniref:Outer membrane protein with beta-barrel domain n=1 Tax=Flavobacterium aciduliphilum TaxID=1101402 RepID=A0A328YLU8_9FLAO|nr:outer membrane beta-barrel protein [Flavobacterium aciduliphilum]RAR71537.1 outer membrane protein with beta-barrel domain [Flavobacterium aciduliphilum]